MGILKFPPISKVHKEGKGPRLHEGLRLAWPHVLLHSGGLSSAKLPKKKKKKTRTGVRSSTRTIRIVSIHINIFVLMNIVTVIISQQHCSDSNNAATHS